MVSHGTASPVEHDESVFAGGPDANLWPGSPTVCRLTLPAQIPWLVG